MHTEKEAENLICPRTYRIGDDGQYIWGTCLGSRCGAWLWTHYKVTDDEDLQMGHTAPGPNWHFSGRSPDGRFRFLRYQGTHGRCGLINPEPADA